MRIRTLVIALLAGAAMAAGGCNKSDTAGEAKTETAAPDPAGSETDKAKGEIKAADEAADEAAGKAAEAGTPKGGVEAAQAPPTEAAPTGAPAGEAAPPGDSEGSAQAAPPPQPTAAEQEAAKAKAAQDERQQRLQAIYELGRKRDDAAIGELQKIMTGDDEPGIRATAIRVLGREPIAAVTPTLKELTRSSEMPVKMEAAIVLYQWGEKKFAEPLLDELSEQGVALRRAFLTGRKDGKNIYEPSAKRFLKKGLDSDNVYTKLDAALGLYEMGEGKTALKVFNDVMQKEETFYVRMAALNYLRHLKNDPDINKIVTAALDDKDERVRDRAKQILDEPAPSE